MLKISLMLSRFLKTLVLIINFSAISFYFSYAVFAWTEPTAVPPANNASAPINVSPTTQTKNGRLNVTALYDANNSSYFIDPSNAVLSGIYNGAVSLGSTVPDATAKLYSNGRIMVENGIWGRIGLGGPSGAFDMEDFWYNGGVDNTFFLRNTAGAGGRTMIGYGVPGAAFTPIMGFYGAGNVIVSPNALTTAPAARLHVDGTTYLSGNVGIGVTASAAKLEISDGGAAANTTARPLVVHGNAGGPTLHTASFYNNKPNGVGAFGYGLTLGARDNDSYGSIQSGQFGANGVLTGPELPLVLNEGAGFVGIGTSDPKAKLDVRGGALLIGAGGDTGAGTRMMWLPGKEGAFRVGRVDGAQWDDANVGWRSFAVGMSTIASGAEAMAVGSYSTASGNESVALGLRNTATQDYSVAIGSYANSTGVGAMTLGNHVNASGAWSTAIGAGITVQGAGSLGIGLGIAAPGVTMWQANTMAIMGGRVGIGTVSPGYVLDVQGTTKVNSAQGYLTNGADYAEYFENEEAISASSLVGLDLNTGKVRKYQEGDEFIGIVSSGAGYIGNGNKDIENDPHYTLVGLVGQLDYDQSQAKVEGRKVYTKDGKSVGVLLNSGKVFIR